MAGLTRVRASIAAMMVAVLLWPLAFCGTQESWSGPKDAAPRAGSSGPPPCPQEDPNIFRCALPGRVEAGTPEKKRLLAAVQRYNDAYHLGEFRTVKRMQSRSCRSYWWEEGGPRGVMSYESYGEPQRITAFRAKIQGRGARRTAYVAYTFEDPKLDNSHAVWTISEDGWEWGNC